MAALVQEAPANARFLGFVNRRDLPHFFAQGRFLVLPSRSFEGFPLVLAEAMGFGLPVIASRIGGLPDIVEDGVTGLLCEPGDAADLAGKMMRLWDDPELCRRLGRAGRAKAQQHYGPEAYCGRLTQAYAQAIRLNRDGPAGRAEAP
jgi:glycosyltransferase involved in cell wall biosynthesis